MGPHILPPAHTMPSLKAQEPDRRPEERKSQGCHSSSQLASPQWQRAPSLVREITTTPQILPLHPSPLLRSSSSAPRPNLGTFAGDAASLPPFVFSLMREKEEGEEGSAGWRWRLWLHGFAFLVLEEEEASLAERLTVALHTNTGWKHKAYLFDSSIVLPQGEWKNCMRQPWDTVCSSLPWENHRFCEAARMEARPRQGIIRHNSMKPSRFGL